jgi:hypothetical protein
MDNVTAADLLAVWERGRSASPGERGLLLLRMAEPEVQQDALDGWSAGRRDACLLGLRERIFGPRLSIVTSCPSCDEALELEVPVADITMSEGRPNRSPMTLSRGDYRVTFRLPSAGDLAVMGAAGPDDGAERRLLERCIVEAGESGAARTAAELPDTLLEAVAAGMASADPQAEVELSLECPACGDAFSSPLDIVSFLWHEIEAHVAGTLRQVALLASAFGWSEREILAMSPSRRACYMELAGT